MSAPFADLEGRFDVILADPPWRFAGNSEKRPGRNAFGHYPCMRLPDIMALPVKEIASKDALLLMWVTVPFAELAFDVVKAWGFKYKSQVTWQKDRIGTGYWARNRHEPVYICTRGRFPCPKPTLFSDSVIERPRQEHSRKPPDIHRAVNRALPDARKLELFARSSSEPHLRGWNVWGNQTEKFSSKDSTSE